MSGVRATDEGMYACFVLEGKEVLARIIKDTTHVDGLYEVQLEHAYHGRDDTVHVPECVTTELRNLKLEKQAKLWIEREKFFGGGYVVPGRRILNGIGREAMRQALRPLSGGKDLVKMYGPVDEAWQSVLNCSFHHDEEFAMRGAEVFDATLAEGGEDYLYPELV